MNKTLLCGALLGLSSVMMAAYVDHGLALSLTDKPLRSIQTALRYHQLYAVFICALALFIPTQTNCWVRHLLTCSNWLFITGILLFSIGIYLAIAAGVTSMMRTVPVGGLILMLGWCGLILAAFIKGRANAIN